MPPVSLLAVLLAGCATSHNYKAGDAKVHAKHVHFSLLASAPRFYRVELPKVPLHEPKQYRFAVRHAPNAIQLTHLFMKLPQDDCRDDRKSEAILPWENVVLAITFMDPTGRLIHSNYFRLGGLDWTFTKTDSKSGTYAGKLFGWYAWSDFAELARSLGTKTDYDVMVQVEQPSARRGDFVQLRGQDVPDYPSVFRK